MEGFLDHLEISGVGLTQKKIWTRRFFKLTITLHVLEFFTDATQQDRKGKLELNGASVVSADELGELLSDTKAGVEKARRFVFRLTESGSKKHHFLCAELGNSSASSSRQYMETWLRALQSCIASQQKSSSMGLAELNAQVSAFMNHMHLAARISDRRHETGKSNYEITIKAWILGRELVANEDQDDDSGPNMSWQILEYSCAWKLRKSTKEIRTFDSQLRQRFGAMMRDSSFPSGTVSSKFHFHPSEAENRQRMEVYDRYLQALLLQPSFSTFGSDASTMLDTFLDISPHLAQFRKLEKELGQSMHLRERKVVPWKDRERFEVVYKMHLEMVAAQEERTHRANVAARRKEPRDRHRSHDHRRHEYQELIEKGKEELGSDYVAPLPGPAKVDASIEESRPGESVRERIARIGHRLVSEAFDE